MCIGTLYGYKVHNEDPVNPWVSQASTALPVNAARLRNLIHAANHLMSHILHFYHLAALDYVNPNVLVGAVPTQLKRPFLCPRYDDAYYINNTRVNAVVGLLPGPAVAALGSLPGFGGDPAGAINAYLVGQYLKALNIRRICHEMQAIFSGRAPQCSGWTPGGATATVDQASVNKYKALLNQVMAFIGMPTDFATGVNGNFQQGRNGTMMFDVVAAAHLFPEYFWIGNSWGNFMAYGWGETGFVNGISDYTNHVLNGLGLVDLAPNNTDARGLARGYRMGGAAFPYGGPLGRTFIPANGLNITQIGESIASSKYNPYPGGGLPNANFRHPWNGVTNPNPAAGYSWLKSPRYDINGDRADASYKVFEVGPLARQVVQGNYYAGLLNALGYAVTPVWGQHGPDIATGADVIGAALRPVYAAIPPEQGLPALTGGPDMSPTGSHVHYNGDSVLDRIAARAVETLLMGLMATQWINDLDGTIGGDGYGPSGCTDRFGENVPSVPTTYRGYGMTEASRGALSHWIALKNGKTTLYQAIVPTTWNASPRDANGIEGPAERSLLSDGGLWLANPKEPIEVIRVTHSYDFCIACAVHLITPKGDVVKVDVPALPG